MAQRKALAFLIAFTLFVMSINGAEAQATRPVSIGVNANWEQNLALSAHLGWTRMDLPWDRINPSNGVWDFSVTDSEVNYALSQGQQILGILHDPPQWVGGGTNANIPPLTTTQWSEFVRQVALRYRAKIAAYEIWNEPDDPTTSKYGIGWGRNIEEPPLYVDFVHAAAVQIRAQAPGTLVVAPVFTSRNTASGVDNRKRRILQQIQAAAYPDGPGYSFIDVISVHNNANDTEPSNTMGWRLNYENLAYVWNHCPSLKTAPIWVTEYGWKANSVGESGQREKICNVTRIYTAALEASYTHLNDWNVRRSFIYLEKDPATSRAIFRSDNSPTPTVTQYLQLLSYPAVQNPALSGDYPACGGSTAFAATKRSGQPAEDVGASFSSLGLLDPRSALQPGTSVLDAERSPDGKSLDVAFQDPKGGVVNVSVSPASSENRSRGLLTDAGAEWTSGALHISVSGMLSGSPYGKGFLRSLAAHIDPAFNRACVIESIQADEKTVRGLGLTPPVAPPGFTSTSSLLELTSPTRACGAAVSGDSPVLDLTWTFVDTAGEVVRAGIYRYGSTFATSLKGPGSLHWADGNGNRYWVAAETDAVTPSLQDSLYAIARSMDSAFP
jgi:hypothetical protein